MKMTLSEFGHGQLLTLKELQDNFPIQLKGRLFCSAISLI